MYITLNPKLLMHDKMKSFGCALKRPIPSHIYGRADFYDWST